MTDKRHLYICTTKRFGPDRPSCGGRGSEKLLKHLKEEVKHHGLNLTIEENPCFGYCSKGINARLNAGAFFHHLPHDDIEGVIKRIKENIAENE